MERRHQPHLWGKLLTVLVVGSFRLQAGDEARRAMREVVEATLGEPGCLWYSYAFDLLDPDLIRVSEGWASQAALDAHLAAPHMAAWRSIRDRLGLSERKILAFAADDGRPL